MMERVQLAPGLEFSRIVYGMWRLGDDADTSPAHIRRKVETCLEQGITTMDQADIYGGYMAEELFGAMLKETPRLRDSIEIITKCDIVGPAGRHADKRVKHYDTTRDHIVTSLDHSLRLMGVEQVDLLLIHRPDPLMDHRETGAALDEIIASGKARHVGVSNFKPYHWTLLQSAMDAPLVTNQIEMSLLHHAPLTNGDLAFLQERDVRPMAWSPLGGGSLFSSSEADLFEKLKALASDFGVDPAAVAVAWILRHPSRVLPVMGTNTIERIARLSEAMKVEMDRQTWFELYTLALGHEVP